MGIRYYFARQNRKFTVEGPVAGGLALVWLGYGRSGLGIVTWESSDFEMLGNAELESLEESGSKRIEKLKFKKSFVVVLLL
jgi:hypothetical protein